MPIKISYTALDFLNTYLEFKSFMIWYEESRKEVFNRYYLSELKSYLKAFDLGEDLYQDFASGKFITKKRTEVNFEKVYQELKTFSLMNNASTFGEKDLKRVKTQHIKRIFRYFLQFSEKLDVLLCYNKSQDTTSLTTSFMINKTNNLLSSFDNEKLNEIHYVLCLIIDPKNQTFTREELIRNYGFPDVDLNDIAADWW